jgi:hypothetical protein
MGLCGRRPARRCGGSGRGDLNGFEEWVSAQQANGRNFKDMDDILAQAMLKKKQAEKDGKKNE